MGEVLLSGGGKPKAHSREKDKGAKSKQQQPMKKKMDDKIFEAGKPIKVSGNSRAEVKQQLDELREAAKAEGLTVVTGGVILYHQGAVGEPDVFDAVITFN